MTGDTHYDLEILAELAEGLLADAEARPVREHLAVCDPCGERLADLAAVREVLAATPTPAMPMGVALRIDQALAEEAGRTGQAAAVAEAPDWDRLMAAAPWETAPQKPQSEPRSEPRPEPVRLGVVTDDGTVVPARRRRRAGRGRRWVMPVTAAAAAAVVIGSAAVSTGLLTASGGSQPAAPVPLARSAVEPSSPEPTPAPRLAYKVTKSEYNFSNRALRQPLGDYFAPAISLGGADLLNDKLVRCVGKLSKKVDKVPFQVDQGYYEGQEAYLMLFWKNRASGTVQVRVVDPECKRLRKPVVGSWE